MFFTQPSPIRIRVNASGGCTTCNPHLVGVYLVLLGQKETVSPDKHTAVQHHLGVDVEHHVIFVECFRRVVGDNSFDISH